MTSLADIKISTKILMLLLMLGAVTIAIAVSGSRTLIATNEANTRLVAEAKAPIYLARANRRAVQMLNAGLNTVVHDGASAQARSAAATELKMYESARSLLGDAVAAKPGLKDGVANFEGQFDRLHADLQRAISLGLANRNDAALVILVELGGRVDMLGKSIADFNDATQRADVAAATALTAAARANSFWLLGLSVVGVAISIGVSLIVSRIGITAPLGRIAVRMNEIAAGNFGGDVTCSQRRDELGAMGKAVQVFRDNGIAKAAADADKVEADATVQMVVETLGASLSELSSRDLTTRVSVEYPGLYAVLKENYNEAVANVRTSIEQVSESARTISTGADEIAQASEDLARRTESNAASLEETSAALTQIEGRLKATATASQSTVARADQAMATVDSGRSTADAAMQAMGRVSGSAKGIDDVIEGLDKIAFQTRVLAMNAAVEAGRAGDAGRGFAVVADLVSALAMRAEEEAKRARDQLSITQSEIVTAVEAVGKVDTALAAISSDVAEVNKLLAGMAADNQAQSSAITEITAAVSSMDRATQQNAAMVEETSAAARNLTQEVGNLAGTAAQFNVDGGMRGASSPARRPAVRVASAPATRPSRAMPAPKRPAASASAANGHVHANGHTNGYDLGAAANGHANGKAAAADWSDF